jgi:hypothetical protein
MLSTDTFKVEVIPINYLSRYFVRCSVYTLFGSLSIRVYWNRDNSVGTAASVVRFLAEAREFSLLQSVQTGSGAHFAPYLMGLKALSPEIKRPERQAHHLPPFDAEAKNDETIPPLYHTCS